MSLLQVRDFWSTGRPSVAGDECDQGCLCVGDVDNTGGGEKIVVGTFEGYLRVYLPSGGVGGDADAAAVAGYDIQDLILEKQLDAPIMQVSVRVVCCPTLLSLQRSKTYPVRQRAVLVHWRDGSTARYTLHALTAPVTLCENRTHFARARKQQQRRWRLVGSAQAARWH
jgi:hypothetical protein